MYESHFGLLTKPFSLRPDPDFFFSSKGHKRALAYLQYGLTQGEGFIVVTGDVGTGKTTLARNLLSTINRENIIAAQLVTTKLEPDDLLRMICGAFGLPAEDKAKAILLQQFEAFLRQAHEANKRVLLIVDEAQNLPAGAIEELRMLSNFQLSDAPLMQSFLLGQPELRAIIQAPSMEQFRQRIIASSHLEPLKADEIKEYILWRLSVAGWAQNPRFAESAFTAIHKHTQGVPRRINIFCDRLLLYCFLEEINQIGPGTIEVVAEELMGEQASASLPVGDSAGGLPVQDIASPQLHANQLSSLQNEIDQLQCKLVNMNKFINESLDEKLRLMRRLDKKLKQQTDALADK